MRLRSLSTWIGVLLLTGLFGCAKPGGDAGTAGGGSGDQAAARAGGEFKSAADLITEDFFAAVVLHPKQIAESPLAAPFLMSAQGRMMVSQLPFNLLELEELVILTSGPAAGPATQGPPTPTMPTMVARFAEPVDREDKMDALAESLRLGGTQREEITQEGQTYYRLGAGVPAVVHWPDDRTMIVSDESMLKKSLSGQAAAGPLAERFRAADMTGDLILVVAMDALPKEFADQINLARQQAPPQLAEFAPGLDHLSALTLNLDLDGDPLVRILLEAKDGEGAAKIEELVGKGRDMLQQTLAGAAQMIPAGRRDQAAPAVQLGEEALAGVSIARDGNTVTFALARPASMDGALPKMIAQSQEAANEAALRSRRRNDLMQIALAMHNHHDAYKTFPAAALRGDDGKPLLSWRVQILPFLGQEALYGEFHVDEPWDSPHNIQLLERMPPSYATPGRESDGKTSIMVFTGEGTPFGGEAGPRFSDIRDGTANTILCVEAGADKAVPWTKPEDLPFDADNPVAALGDLAEGYFLAAFCDGTVRVIPVDLDPKTLGNLVTHADGQAIPDF